MRRKVAASDGRSDELREELHDDKRGSDDLEGQTSQELPHARRGMEAKANWTYLKALA